MPDQHRKAEMLNAIVVINVALLITHQIDAAYWHEWDMFNIPGGIQLFNVINTLAFIVVLGCLIPVFRRDKSGFVCSLAVAGLSALVLPIHAGFAVAGSISSRSPYLSR